MKANRKKNGQEQRALACLAIQGYSYPNQNRLSTDRGEEKPKLKSGGGAKRSRKPSSRQDQGNSGNHSPKDKERPASGWKNGS